MATYRVIVSLEIEADDAEDAAAEATNIVTDSSMVIESIAPIDATGRQGGREVSAPKPAPKSPVVLGTQRSPAISPLGAVFVG